MVRAKREGDLEMTAHDQPHSMAEFGIRYEGGALADNLMDVRDLAPALLALGQLFDRSNELLNGRTASVSLNIRATRSGSFDLLLQLSQIADVAVDMLTSGIVTAAVNLQGIVVGGGMAMSGGLTVFKVYKLLKGRKATEIGRETDHVILEIDKLRLTVPNEVFTVYQDRNARSRARAFIDPLLRPGIDRVVIHERGKQVDSIETADAEFFDLLDDDAEVNEIVIPRQVLRLVSPHFVGGKWRFNDGTNTNWYAITDRPFMRDVDSGLRRFGVGDVFYCEVRTLQILSPDGQFDTQREIVHVMEFRRHSQQGRQLYLGDEDN